MNNPGRVGVIADNTLQGHLLSSAIKGQGYQVLISTDPDNLEPRWLQKNVLDLWVVDLSSEDRWQQFLDTLLEQAEIPILFSDGQAPSRTDTSYPRWERRLVTKLVDFIGKPVSVEKLDKLASQPARTKPAVIPTPQEFKLPTSSHPLRPQRVWILGASLGGPAAVKQFLDCLPANLPVAFVLAQHIDGGFLDTLCGVLSRDNHIRCKVGVDGETLKHGELAIAPVEYAIKFRHDGRILGTNADWEGPYAPSIDQVIQHAGEAFGHHCGVILFSGMGNDGAIAAPQLAAQGCPVWAQSSETCAVSSQPDATRDTGCVSFSGSPEQLALQLVEQVRKELAGQQPNAG